MRSLSFTSVLLLLVMFVTGCSDQVAPTAALQQDAATHLEANKNGPPASSGPNVVRYEDQIFFAITDPKTGTRAWFGVDVIAFCEGVPLDQVIDFMSLKEISVPEDVNRINQMVKGDDVTTSVWNPAPGSGQAGFCEDVLGGVGLMATGTSDLRSTDNDLNVFLNPDNRNANAFGFNAHGTLLSPSGETVRVNAHSRCVWDGVDGVTLKCNDKVNAH